VRLRTPTRRRTLATVGWAFAGLSALFGLASAPLQARELGRPRITAQRSLESPVRPELLRFTPDGSGLLVAGPKRASLWRIDLAGGPARLLTKEPGAGVWPTLSAEGDTLFYRSRAPGDPVARVQRLSLEPGAQAATLYAGPELGFPEPLPDGRALVLSQGSLLLLGERSGSQGAAADPLSWAGANERSPLAPPLAGGPALPLFDHLGGRRVLLLQGSPLQALVDHGNFVMALPLGPDGAAGRRVLSSGDGFFLGEASPDGTRAVLHESRGAEGYAHLIEPGPRGLRRRELGPAHDCTWLGPEVLVYAALKHDSRRVTHSDLWVFDLRSRETWPLQAGGPGLEVLPAASADGRLLAWVDAGDGSLHLATVTWEVQP